MKLNIGCGRLPQDGYKNIDISKEAAADEFYDVCEGIKEKDNSVEEVFSGCMLEQIESNKDFVFVMNEIWRVLKPNGMFAGYVPTPHQNVIYQDPMDKRFFRMETFDYFDSDKHHWKEFGSIYGFKPWHSIELNLADNGILHFKMKPQK